MSKSVAKATLELGGAVPMELWVKESPEVAVKAMRTHEILPPACRQMPNI